MTMVVIGYDRYNVIVKGFQGVNFINILIETFFHLKEFRQFFSYYCLALQILCRKNIDEKVARKMLMKLTQGVKMSPGIAFVILIAIWLYSTIGSLPPFIFGWGDYSLGKDLAIVVCLMYAEVASIN
jgi:hypothetical protein